jgi:non-ribosomal peptide synthetase component F
VESTIQTFRAELKGPLGLHYAKHHVFPIHSHKQMCSIVDSTTLQFRVSNFAQSGEETKIVPVRYFMVKHSGFSRFSWNPISKVLKWRWWRTMDDANRHRLSAYGLDSHWIRICCICACAVTSGYPVTHELIRNLHYLCEGVQHPIGWSLIAVVLHPHN